MSEYQERHTVARLIGAPPGYVGYEEGGQLTEAVRRRPYSVVLFDETEKAHAELFNVLLQLLDDGRLTDAKGCRINFKNTIVIMTSNIGSHLIQEFGVEEAEEGILNALRQHFRPEFLNRIDEIVIFHSLSMEDLVKIVNIQLKHLRQLLANQRIMRHASVSFAYHRRSQTRTSRRRLRSNLWRTSPQARHPTTHPKPTGSGAAERAL